MIKIVNWGQRQKVEEVLGALGYQSTLSEDRKEITEPAEVVAKKISGTGLHTVVLHGDDGNVTIGVDTDPI